MNKMFGLVGELTKKQSETRVYHGKMPIGERFLILNELPNDCNLSSVYDVVGFFVISLLRN